MREKAITLMDVLLPNQSLVRDVSLVLGFSVLTAICARIAFYIGPVPITGQTFAVLLAGALLGSRRGALSQLTYLGIGATGIPFWFAPMTPLGAAAFLGPTGGYLIGFVPAAFVVGLLAEQGWDRRFWTTACAMLAGTAVIYLFGLTWITHYVPASTVLEVGLYPFIPGDMAKLVLAALALSSAWMLVSRRRR